MTLDRNGVPQACHGVAWLERALREEHGVGDCITYTAFLQRSASQRPDRTALVCGERSLTYAQTFDAIAARAGYLAQVCRIRAGERVALLMDNSELYQLWYLAVLAMGAVAVPINTRLTAREIDYQVRDANVRRILTQQKFDAVLGPLEVPRTDADAPLDASQQRFDIAAAGVRTDSPAAIYFTSGTTGHPKGVVHTHRSLIAGTVQGPSAWEYDAADAVTLAMTPLFHIANHTWFLPVLHVGGTMVVDTFRTESVLDLILSRGITHLFAVPTMLLMMIGQHAKQGGDFLQVRTVAFGAAPMPPEKLAEVQRLFPRAAMVHGMGQTESCGTIVTLPSALAFEKAGSVGIPIAGAEVRVAGSDGQDVAPKQVGELLARGPNVMSHYHGQPQATADTLAQGWLHTGDLGYLDEDGFLFLVDRKKDMIIRGGENVYSSEVENVLYMHPGVAQAAVVAARSALFGEEVFAFVVRRDPGGETPDGESLRAHCARHLADFKVPVEIAFLPAMPQTATGKIQKRVLRERLPERWR
ncbi:MAG: AMP-binding protein [Burkholderiaceae bacterium]|nr:AMP-binding protein [Burkholderiaceae bacterium]